jgi:hypothetical protein
MEQSPTRSVPESIYRAPRVLLTREGVVYRTLRHAPTFTSAAVAHVRGDDVRILPPHERPILALHMESLTVDYRVCEHGVA